MIREEAAQKASLAGWQAASMVARHMLRCMAGL
jgi:hypothetical protein